MKKRLNQLINSDFFRSVFILVGGTAFSQALNVVALPLLTRLYTPEDFSILAVYVSLLALATVIACLRLEIAIPLPESDQEGANLLAASCISVLTVSSIVAVFIFFFSGEFARLKNGLDLVPYLWLLPIGITATGLYNAFQFWATRKKKFKRIAKTRVTQSITGVVFQAGLGVINIAPAGLLFGHLIKSGAGVFRLLIVALKEDHKSLARINIAGIEKVLVKYQRFPKYSVLEALSNSLSTQLPIIIIASLSQKSETGFVFLAMRTMQIPVSFIGSSISQVYLAKASDEYRNGNLSIFTQKILSNLIYIGGGPLIFFGIVAPEIFSIIFGQGWQRSGELITWMTPWFIFQLLASPVSMSLHVINQQKVALFLQFFGLVIRVLPILAIASWNVQYISETYAVSSFLFYVVYLVVILTYQNIQWIDASKLAIKSTTYIFICVCLSFLIRFILLSLIT